MVHHMAEPDHIPHGHVAAAVPHGRRHGHPIKAPGPFLLQPKHRGVGKDVVKIFGVFRGQRTDARQLGFLNEFPQAQQAAGHFQAVLCGLGDARRGKARQQGQQIASQHRPQRRQRIQGRAVGKPRRRGGAQAHAGSPADARPPAGELPALRRRIQQQAEQQEQYPREQAQPYAGTCDKRAAGKAGCAPQYGAAGAQRQRTSGAAGPVQCPFTRKVGRQAQLRFLQRLIEGGLQAVQLAHGASRREKRVKKDGLVLRAARGQAFFPYQPQVLLPALYGEIALGGEPENQREDVPVIRRIVDDIAHLGAGHAVWRRTLGRDHRRSAPGRQRPQQRVRGQQRACARKSPKHPYRGHALAGEVALGQACVQRNGLARVQRAPRRAGECVSVPCAGNARFIAFAAVGAAVQRQRALLFLRQRFFKGERKTEVLYGRVPPAAV